MTVSTLLKARHVGIKELKNHLSELLRTGRPLVATDRGEPTSFIVPYDDMVEIVEILEELSDPEIVKSIQEGRKAYKNGGWIPVSRLWKKLGIPDKITRPSRVSHR